MLEWHERTRINQLNIHMPRVIFYPKAYDAIEGFSDFRMAYFERVYSDTGIF